MNPSAGKILSGGVVVLAVALTVACPPQSRLGEGEIASVDGTIITSDDLSARFWQGPESIRSQSLKKGGRHYLLDAVVDELLLDREARRRGLAVSFTDIRPLHHKLMKQFLRAEFESTVSASQISDEALRAEYKRMVVDLTVPLRRQIQVFGAKTRDEADQLFTRLEKARHAEEGPAELEKIYNELDSREDGILPEKGRRDFEAAALLWGSAIAEAAFAVDIEAEGIYHEPVQYEKGWAVVVVLAELVPPPVPSFEKIEKQVRQRVFDRFRDDELTRFTEGFREHHEVVLHEEAMEFVPWVMDEPTPARDPAAGPTSSAASRPLPPPPDAGIVSPSRPAPDAGEN